jgi:hypothetical protein
VSLTASLTVSRTASPTVVTPRAFLNCIGAWDRRFTGGAQHDSQVRGLLVEGLRARWVDDESSLWVTRRARWVDDESSRWVKRRALAG